MMRSSRRFGPRSNGYVQLHSPRCHPAVAPEDDRSTGPPEGVVLDLGEGPDLDRLRGDRERLPVPGEAGPRGWLGRPRLAVDHAARSVAPERGSAASGAGFSPRIAYSSDDMVVIQSLVASGMGVAPLPEPRSKRAGRQGSTPQNSRTTPSDLCRHVRRPWKVLHSTSD